MSHKSLMDTRLLDKDRPNWTGPGGKWRKMRKDIKKMISGDQLQKCQIHCAIALFVPWNSILWMFFTFSFFSCKLSKQQALILSSKRRLVPRANSFVTFCQLIKPEINRQDLGLQSGKVTTLPLYIFTDPVWILSIRVFCLLFACYFFSRTSAICG